MTTTNANGSAGTSVHDEIRELRRDVADVMSLIEVVLRNLGVSAEQAKRAREILRDQRGVSLFAVPNATDGFYCLWERGWTTLELVAMQGRPAVAALPGVGRVTMRRLDAALPEHQIRWATPAAPPEPDPKPRAPSAAGSPRPELVS